MQTREKKSPKLLVVADPWNSDAKSLAKRFAHLESKRPDLIAVFGGDGTMLRAIRRYWRRKIPFVGVNLGHRGFLMSTVANVTPEFFTGPFIRRVSPLLEVEVTKPNGAKRRTFAFNDAHVRARTPRAGWFEVEVDGEVRIPKLVADGVLVSTAAGSTAYATAMGAHPVPIGTEVLIVVGSNVAEPRSWKHGANLPLGSEVVFRTKDSGRWRKIYGVADSASLGEVVEMRIRSSKTAKVELLFTPDHDLARKLALLQFPSQ
ncbi:MAG: inorganic polyphosphate/ATP-NAD kinase [Parcubacteria group bacterium GW2011_GWB1_52_7]|nr:MAG: inorganic polyphosphate/ATP-NAD kinase [Parcubacteria group bacterium GW2011_GWA1_51_12]KKW29169.1 MAG: inorganic polyphosphate/ATP-NAD kinase [Parcubacteria group bacterium GW2011_GWB1_52_7]KKW31703.1 MAG: inorganic polyphosphate/ATP-NAD kinase [Parcubacteria group bacterium GW2011_GWC2_52_8c]